jgi:hypothetical protein
MASPGARQRLVDLLVLNLLAVVALHEVPEQQAFAGTVEVPVAEVPHYRVRYILLLLFTYSGVLRTTRHTIISATLPN